MATSPRRYALTSTVPALRNRVLAADTAVAITLRQIRGRRRAGAGRRVDGPARRRVRPTPQAGYQALASAWSSKPGHWTAQPAIRHASSPTPKIHRERAALNGLHAHIDAMIERTRDRHRRDLAAPRR